MATFHLIHSTETEEDFTDIVQGKFQFYRGLKTCIGDPKGHLIQSKMSTFGLHGMGGGGKTALALALCGDHHINEDFSNNVIFITVSQFLNRKRILETMWAKIAGRKRQEFQNLEYGHMQLQQLILMQPKTTLMALVDLWSRANLEYSLFEGPAHQTFITSRKSSTILRTLFNQLYPLPFFCREDALSLICFWASGQTSIPSTEGANLLKEVHPECDGLPLVLKVIGSSLNEEPYTVWERAKGKIYKEESISDIQKRGLVRYTGINIDSLDHIAKECFLDLGLLVEDKEISLNAFLDIWVYVWKLQQNDPFAILSELASTILLNLTSNPGTRAVISHGNVSELYFSQPNVSRETPLYQRYRDTVVPKEEVSDAYEKARFARKMEVA